MGHPRSLKELQHDTGDASTSIHHLADKFIWTYISPEFPMAQFKLSEPALCIGGFLQVELLGRVQRQETDGLYYICITHVQIVGRPLLPRFDIEILDATGSCALKYLPETGNSRSPKGDNGASSRFYTFTARLLQRGTRGWERMILNTLLRAGALMLVSSLEIVHDMYRLAYVSFGQFRVTIQLYLSFCSLSNVIEP
ncbi:hypothetical protein PTKIN_Ptkin04bG0130400 [Pterospermum kingtungense]